MLARGLQPHQIDDVNHTNFQLGQMLTKNGNCSQDLQRGRVSAACHHHVRLATLVIAGPLPDAKPFRAVDNRGVHAQPLRQCMLAGDDHIDVVPVRKQ